jgi:hypothetical protein
MSLPLPYRKSQVAMLARLPWLDELDAKAMRIGTGVEGVAGELGAIVDGDPLRCAVPSHQRVEDLHDSLPRQGESPSIASQSLGGDSNSPSKITTDTHSSVGSRAILIPSPDAPRHPA